MSHVKYNISGGCVTSGTSGTSGAGTSGTSGVTGSSGTSGINGFNGDLYRTPSYSTTDICDPALIIVNTELAYSAGQKILVAHDGSNLFEATVTSYNRSTGELVYTDPINCVGSGTYSTWTVNLAGASGGDGSSGTSGSNGSSGTNGTSGTNGKGGSSGTSGLTGTSGDDGTSGTSGTSGLHGTSGTSGANGGNGSNGTSGTHGTSGSSGTNGTSGTSGNDGTSGTSGIDGTFGTSGTSGFNGTNGTNGTSGTRGSNGTSGTTGTSGSSGTSGTDGTSGSNGTNGTTGSAGTSGSSGTSGTGGTSGSSGISGTSGSSGTTGTSGSSGDSGNLYRTSSASSFTLGNSGTLVVETYLSYTPAQSIIIVHDVNNFQECEVITYNESTGVLVFEQPTRTVGSGTYSSWIVNLDGASGGDGSSGTSGSSGIDGNNGTSGTTGTSGSAGTSGSDGSSGTSGISPDVALYVPYTGATGNVNLGVNTILSGKSLIGSQANFTRFPNALAVISEVPSGAQHNESLNIGLMSEAISSGTTWGSGVYGAGYTNSVGSGRGTGVTGEGHVSAAADTGVAVGVRGYANDVHTGNYNIGLYGDAENGDAGLTYGGNVALFLANGNIVTSAAAAKKWYLGGNLTFDGQGTTKTIGVTNGANINVQNASTGVGIYANNTSTGYGIAANNTSSGTGITVGNTSTGIGIDIANNSTGKGISCFTQGTGTGVYLINGSTGKNIHSINTTGIGIYSENSGAGTGFISGNSSTGTGISSSNSSTGIGIQSSNTNTGNGIRSLNSSSGNGIVSSNTGTGNGITSTNTSSGIGFLSNNSSNGTAIVLNNSSTGTAISSVNSSTGKGIVSTNTGVGDGMYSNNNSTGRGVYLSNGSSGQNLVLNNTTAATGMPFTISKNNVDKFTINDAGDATGNSFIKTGGTSSQFLKADGSVDSNAYALLNDVVTLSTNQTITGSKTFTVNNSNTGLLINSTSNGSGAIRVEQSVAGTGIWANNTSTGAAILAYNASTGYGLQMANMSTGKALYIGNAADATGDPFVYTLGGAAFMKAKIDYLGNITGNSFVKTGGTSSQYLMADGSVSTGGGVSGSGTSGYIPKFTASTTIGNSNLQTSDYFIGIGSGSNGFTPSSSQSVIALGGWNSYILGSQSYGVQLGKNNYFNGTNWIYSQNNSATQYEASFSSHTFRVAASGIGGNAITWNNALTINSTGASTFSNNVTASSFIKSGGTGSEYLMADGSVTTGPDLSGYLPLTGGTLSGQLIATSPGFPQSSLILKGNFDFGSMQFGDTTNYIIRGGTDFVGMEFIVGGSQKMLILDNGNTGIGSSNPEFKLDVSGGDIALSRFQKLQFTGGTVGDRNRAYIGGNGNNDLIFAVAAGAEAMRIHNSSNVLIGTTTDAGYKLDVNGTGRFVGSGYGSDGIYATGANGGRGVFSVAGGSGGSGVYGFTSDLSSYGGTFENSGAGAGVALRVLGFSTFSQAATFSSTINLRGDSAVNTSQSTIGFTNLRSGTWNNAQIEVVTGANVWAGNLVFKTASDSFANVLTERMRVSAGGFTRMTNTGSYYGTTNGSYHEMLSDVNNQNNVIFTHTGTSPYGPWVKFSSSPNNTTNYFLAASDGTNDKFIIYSNGSMVNRTGSYGTISDIKYKENITDASSKLEDILELKVRNFNLIGDDKKQIGFIAQEFEEVFPGMVDVSTEKAEEGVEPETYKSIKTSVLTPILVKAIQEQQEIIKQLTNRIINLENK